MHDMKYFARDVLPSPALRLIYRAKDKEFPEKVTKVTKQKKFQCCSNAFYYGAAYLLGSSKVPAKNKFISHFLDNTLPSKNWFNSLVLRDLSDVKEYISETPLLSALAARHLPATLPQEAIAQLEKSPGRTALLVTVAYCYPFHTSMVYSKKREGKSAFFEVDAFGPDFIREISQEKLAEKIASGVSIQRPSVLLLERI
ncbi:MAG: hypothetical protein NT051_06165 [Candidatus Micrarchaeota archaeon]|nr:hypothetical protein [Candidatus Micrarchaeota archaeon]